MKLLGDFRDSENQIDLPSGETRDVRLARSGGGPSPTPFAWRDPSTLPRRPWLYGRHLLRGQVSVTVAPGGVGKSSLTIAEALAMTSGRDLLGDRPVGRLRVWLLNLEDPRDELERRITGAMLHHHVLPEEVEGRLFVDSGREKPLCTAVQVAQGLKILEPVMASLEAQLRARRIDVLVVDPFVSSHQVNENDNGAIDRVAKEWARLAERANCAVELIHHTRKLNGESGSSESGRGASALLAAARSGRVLNKMTDKEKTDAGLKDDPATYFSVTRDKANLAPLGKRVWRRMASVELANGDSVGVAEPWEWPDTSVSVTAADLHRVQTGIDGHHPRYSDKAGETWAGHIVASVLDLDIQKDRGRIKRLIEGWLRDGALQKVKVKVGSDRHERPCLEVGEWAVP